MRSCAEQSRSYPSQAPKPLTGRASALWVCWRVLAWQGKEGVCGGMSNLVVSRCTPHMQKQSSSSVQHWVEQRAAEQGQPRHSLGAAESELPPSGCAGGSGHGRGRRGFAAVRAVAVWW